ncbi:MAG: terminase TerL endonuclease subunit [Dehalococcoidia bacterium]
MSRRVYATSLMGFRGDDGDSLTPHQSSELEACRHSFRHFLPYWQFTNRETGEIGSLAAPWTGQVQLAELIESEPWIFALKAGKLGFTELECAYDGWVARFRQLNARVHLFSRDARAAQDLLSYVRFGLTHLPEWMQLRPMCDEPGGDTITSLKLFAGPDDIRTIVSYAAGPHVAIDQTATHSHVDELAHMPFPEKTWSAIQTTIAPNGSCHIVTRGAGDGNFVATLWSATESGESRLFPFFAPWDARPDRDRAWREKQSATLPYQGFLHFAPECPEDALAGDETAIYIPLEVWDRCYDPGLPLLMPGDRTPIVLGVDAAVTGDMFAVVAVSRHPHRPDDPAIRACRAWRPSDSGGRIDFDDVERFIRFLCNGGCPGGHPREMPHPSCEACAAGDFSVPRHNVVEIVYDPYQMEDMAQRLRRDGVAWCGEFSQTAERLVADGLLHKLALRGALAHHGDPLLREHIGNARAKLSNEDSRMRIIKRAPGRRIDLAVAASMAVKQILYLNL